jgi:hypothetical protein
VSKHRFEARLTKSEGTGTYVVVPLDVPALFGSRRPPVSGTVNGFSFRTTLAPYGDDWYLGFNSKVREEAGIAARETVVVELERDDEPRERGNAPAPHREGGRPAPRGQDPALRG